MSISKEKIANPLNFYKKPSDVAHDRKLSLDNKIKTLDNWLNDIELQHVAAEENMPGEREDQREQVDYLRRLLRTYRAHQHHTDKSRH
ncbi:MAG: hypothetical protein K0U37_02400 [Gammaproteobacteria bacterium]|nr:hypothetical protein [Gammaproteobacteria bacterium]